MSSTPFHPHCFACKSDNPHSLNLTFHSVSDDSVEGHFITSEQYQGYPHRLHGGITSTLLDAAMTHCLYLQGIEAVTAELTVRFIQPVPLDSLLTIRASFVSGKRKLFQLEAWLLLEKEVLAHASSKFMLLG